MQHNSPKEATTKQAISIIIEKVAFEAKPNEIISIANIACAKKESTPIPAITTPKIPAMFRVLPKSPGPLVLSLVEAERVTKKRIKGMTELGMIAKKKSGMKRRIKQEFPTIIRREMSICPLR